LKAVAVPVITLAVYLLTRLVYDVYSFRTIPEATEALMQARPTLPCKCCPAALQALCHTFMQELKAAKAELAVKGLWDLDKQQPVFGAAKVPQGRRQKKR
jgi:hypothetical protein